MSGPENKCFQPGDSQVGGIPVFRPPEVTTTISTFAPPMPLPDLHFPAKPSSATTSAATVEGL